MSGHQKKDSQGRRLTGDERRLWRGVARSVKPLRAAATELLDDEAEPPVEMPKPAVRSRAQSNTSAPGVAPKVKAPPPLAVLDRRLKQRLARGHEAIEARIDLHGKTQAEAHAALLSFLRRAQSDGKTFVLVITGKGARGSADMAGERGVLKRQVPLWLTLPEFRAFVLGFDDAHAGHGGAGALYVRLRKRKD